MKLFYQLFSASSAAVLTVALVALCGGQAAHAQETLTLTLDNGGVFSGAPGSIFNVTGSLTNNLGNGDALDLTSATLSFSGPDFAGGTTPPFNDEFSFNETGTLAPGQTLSGITFFMVDATGLPAGTTYTGDTITVQGNGADPNTAATFQSGPVATSFRVNVVDTNPVPEASSSLSFGILLIGGTVLFLSARKRQANRVS